MTSNLLLKTFCSACPKFKGSQPNSEDPRKSTLMIFQRVGVVVVLVVYGGGGGRGIRERERMREGFRDGSTKSCRKGSRVRVETDRSLYQFLNKHANSSQALKTSTQ